MSLLDGKLISDRYFFPRSDAPDKIVRVPVDGATLACAAWRVHGGAAPLLVHFHGNGETVADYVPHFAELFAAAGIDTFFSEYRGYGGSTGSPSLVAMLDDAVRVIDFLGVPAERVFAYGRSVGSIYAIEAAHRRHGLGGLVIESGIASPLERVLMRVRPSELGVSLAEIEREAAQHLDHEARLRGYPGRVLVMHAAHDDLVDPSHAKRNASWARTTPVLFPHGDHNTILAENLAEIVETVARFVFARV